MEAKDLFKLKDFFRPEDIQFRPITIVKKREGWQYDRALAAAYVDSRAIQDRLDEVCSPEGWQDEYCPGPAGGVMCRLSVKVADEWITKCDAAENSDIEPVKGGISNALRRAAVKWGMGRYLYDLKDLWVDCITFTVDNKTRFKKFVTEPQIPAEFLPAGYKPKKPVPPPQKRPSEPMEPPTPKKAPAQNGSFTKESLAAMASKIYGSDRGATMKLFSHITGQTITLINLMSVNRQLGEVMVSMFTYDIAKYFGGDMGVAADKIIELSIPLSSEKDVREIEAFLDDRGTEHLYELALNKGLD